jgi:isocitrate dehydrogenase
MISNRGAKVWPGGKSETFCTDHWRCRFENNHKSRSQQDLIKLLQRLTDLNIIQIEALCTYNDELGFSKTQRE